MTITTRRDPTDAIHAPSGYWAETACVAQLLYMHGLWDGSAGPGEGISLAPLDARIGRAPGQPDLDAGSLRVLLEEGFRIRHVTGDDLHLLATDTDYLRQVLVSEGRESPAQIDAKLSRWAPMVQARNTAELALYDQYPNQVELVQHMSSWTDVEEMLADGWLVGIATINDDGTSAARLVTGRDGTNYQIFSPLGPYPLDWYDAASAWSDYLCQGVNGYRLA